MSRVISEKRLLRAFPAAIKTLLVAGLVNILSGDRYRQFTNLVVDSMGRSSRRLPPGHSFHITLRCNSRQFLIAKGLRRDVLLAVLAKAKQKVPHRLYAVCLMANHLHLLIRPDDATQLPKLMNWIGWTSAMVINRLSDLCEHCWETKLNKTKGIYRRRWTGELTQD